MGAADLSKLGEILEPFPAIEPEWNCSSSTHTTAHLYLSSANASALPEHADKGDVLVLQVAGSKDWTYAPVSERHVARRDETHQSRALVREHATLTPGSAMRIPADASHAYVAKVHAAGGWKRYERAHRMRLTTTFARVVFPSVPKELVAHIVDLWAHVGYY